MLCFFAAGGADAVHVAVAQWRSGVKRADKLARFQAAFPVRSLRAVWSDVKQIFDR
jgi:hypothetical protein